MESIIYYYKILYSLILLHVLTANVLQMIAGVTVPHQTTADGSQYAVSAKATTTKDNHVGNDDVNKQQENQAVCIL